MCQWILLPAVDDNTEGACGAPVQSDSRYCPEHQEEMHAFITANSNIGSDSRSSV